MAEPDETHNEDQPPTEPEAPPPEPAVVHLGPYHWRIEGREVFLRQRDADGIPAPDTEDEARRVMAEAFAHRE